VALPLALMHQAMAMVALTFATIHLARLMPSHAVSERMAALTFWRGTNG
jgi:hypothetical protein